MPGRRAEQGRQRAGRPCGHEHLPQLPRAGLAGQPREVRAELVVALADQLRVDLPEDPVQLSQGAFRLLLVGAVQGEAQRQVAVGDAVVLQLGPGRRDAVRLGRRSRVHHAAPARHLRHRRVAFLPEVPLRPAQPLPRPVA